jgi:hypothetical protein
MQIEPHLLFNGRCEAALADGGQVQMPLTKRSSPSASAWWAIGSACRGC